MGRLSPPDAAFWRQRRVLLTGHTGFKGAWLARILRRWGARGAGVALPPAGEPSLFGLCQPWPQLDSRMLDLRDRVALRQAVAEIDPEVAIHLAAQSLVPQSYREPVDTFAVNVLGTAHLLEALGQAKRLQALVVATSDKVYRNDGRGRAFAEDDPLGGDDPYSASKAACEHVVQAWRASGLVPGVRLITVRAGNVIGGGDFAADRLVPDIVRALTGSGELTLRLPEATRPWQHVLDVLCGYLQLAAALTEARPALPPAMNLGPADARGPSVRELVHTFTAAVGRPLKIRTEGRPTMPEKSALALDASAALALGWRPRLDLPTAIEWTAAWYREAMADWTRAGPVTDRQIDAYFAR